MSCNPSPIGENRPRSRTRDRNGGRFKDSDFDDASSVEDGDKSPCHPNRYTRRSRRNRSLSPPRQDSRALESRRERDARRGSQGQSQASGLVPHAQDKDAAALTAQKNEMAGMKMVLAARLQRLEVVSEGVPANILFTQLTFSVLTEPHAERLDEFNRSGSKGVEYCFEALSQYGHRHPEAMSGVCFCDENDPYPYCITVKKLDDAVYGPIQFGRGRRLGGGQKEDEADS